MDACSPPAGSMRVLPRAVMCCVLYSLYSLYSLCSLMDSMCCCSLMDSLARTTERSLSGTRALNAAPTRTSVQQRCQLRRTRHANMHCALHTQGQGPPTGNSSYSPRCARYATACVVHGAHTTRPPAAGAERTEIRAVGGLVTLHASAVEGRVGWGSCECADAKLHTLHAHAHLLPTTSAAVPPLLP
jgi:hypothetical protein